MDPLLIAIVVAVVLIALLVRFVVKGFQSELDEAARHIADIEEASRKADVRRARRTSAPAKLAEVRKEPCSTPSQPAPLTDPGPDLVHTMVLMDLLTPEPSHSAPIHDYSTPDPTPSHTDSSYDSSSSSDSSSSYDSGSSYDGGSSDGGSSGGSDW